jgi:hypothetical protein
MAKKTTTTKKVSEKKATATETKQKASQKSETKLMVAEAIIMYQNDTTINENIVNGTLTDKQKDCVEKLDKAMCPLSDMELNRLVSKTVIAKYMEQAGVTTIDGLVGKTIENVPFMSMSKRTLHDILEKRYSLGLDKPNCIVVHTGITGKVKGLDVEIELREEGIENTFKHQQEIILARGQKFLIKKIVMGDGWGEAYPILHLYAV